MSAEPTREWLGESFLACSGERLVTEPGGGDVAAGRRLLACGIQRRSLSYREWAGKRRRDRYLRYLAVEGSECGAAGRRRPVGPQPEDARWKPVRAALSAELPFPVRGNHRESPKPSTASKPSSISGYVLGAVLGAHAHRSAKHKRPAQRVGLTVAPLARDEVVVVHASHHRHVVRVVRLILPQIAWIVEERGHLPQCERSDWFSAHDLLLHIRRLAGTKHKILMRMSIRPASMFLRIV